MVSPINTQHILTPHLQVDGYLKGIRDEFERLNHELDETKGQRDEYIRKYWTQVKELQELRQTISNRENNTVCQHARAWGNLNNSPPLISGSDRLHNPENAKKIYHLARDRFQEGGQNEINVAPDASPNVPIPANKPGYSAWDVGFNGNLAAKLNLNLVHKLTEEGRIRLAFSEDGKCLATASSTGIVSIFDSGTGKRTSVMKDLYRDQKTLPGYRCLGFSPDSKYLATGEQDGSVRIWIISQKRVRNTFRHRQPIYSLNFSPNGRHIVTCSSDRTIIMWRLRDGSSRVLTASEIYAWSVRFSLDGRYIASGDSLGGIQIWNVRTEKMVASWLGHSHVVACLVFTPDGKGLLSASWDKQVIQWDVSSLSSLGMTDPPISRMREISRLIGHTVSRSHSHFVLPCLIHPFDMKIKSLKSNITTVSISPDGKWIASGSWDNTMRIWNAFEATSYCILHCPGWVRSADFSPVGGCLAIGGDFEDVTIWNYVNP